MAESTALKDYFNKTSITRLAKEVSAVYPEFSERKFINRAAKNLEPLELKERVNHIAEAYREFLPEDYPKALSILTSSMAPPLPNARDVQGMDTSFAYWPIAHFIEVYGLDHLDASIQGMYEITQRFTAEWAIRPFIVKYPDKMLKVLKKWSKDKSMHVRRLVSEGSRTRLPWGMRLHLFIEDPEPVRPLLNALKNDPSLYVRRSVANHLNDLTKDHPDWVLDLLEEWGRNENKNEIYPEYSRGNKNKNGPKAENRKENCDENIRWTTNHALRSLIKAGDKRTLKLLGFGKAKVALNGFDIHPKKIKMGESLEFSFSIESKAAKPQQLMIDYLIHFVKANGSRSPKVFKLGKKTIPGKKVLEIRKKHSIKPITTRVYYPGIHKIEVQVNGEILGGMEFELKV